MNFIEAIKEVEKGNKVRLKIWDKDTHIKKADNGNFTIFYGNKQSSQTTHTEILLNSIGWEIVKLAEKLHTFEEALAALKLGKKIMRLSSETQFWHHKPEVGKAPRITVSNGWLAIVDNCFSTEDMFANDWIIKG